MACTHGSPWSYDTYVPVIVVVPDVSAGTVDRRINPLDIAPTLSALIGARPPSGTRGNPLLGVVGD